MHSPASQSARWDTIGDRCRKLALQYRCIYGRFRNCVTHAEGDLQGSRCTKFLERMRSTRERSYPTMANTNPRVLKASIKSMLYEKKIKWYKKSWYRHARVLIQPLPPLVPKSIYAGKGLQTSIKCQKVSDLDIYVS